MILKLRRTLLRPLAIAALLFSFQIAEARSDEPAPTPRFLTGSLSEDGHARIAWDVPPEGTYVELQQAGNENFNNAETIYRGPDGATFISGLRDGTYYYRLRVADGPWSEAIVLTVKHHSLQLALILCSLGAIVFALTVFMVVKGAFRASAE